MNVAPLLIAYAGLLTFAGPVLLRRARWTDKAPRLALATWFSLAGSAVAAAVLSGVVLVVPYHPVGGGLPGFLRSCLAALDHQWGPTGARLVATTALLVTAVTAARLAYAAVVVLSRQHRTRRAHLDGIRLRARPDRRTGTLLLDRATPAAWCLPGDGGTVVVTTGALRAVDAAGLAAVLAHERAHLAGRHHVLTDLARVLRRAFPGLPLFAQLPAQVDRLVELRADDVAAGRSSRRGVATALLALALSGAPRAALAASGGDTVRRVERLLAAPERLTGLARGGVVTGNAASLLLPVMLAAVPAFTVAQLCCR
ncbi:peptidase M48-like protein [Stackebrandtia albiflava]|uniref:Peptidase M48-like protein n=1 Tax=Stackebrandtia albiflava TaxID=406432 RepID=A0A562V242_9ACTN|nr:M56 family metallopeptidase [Stackebrandtia albiflava]TWJ11882.1 peptidase M48-like protein [Stackebrandtia albiflava]